MPYYPNYPLLFEQDIPDDIEEIIAIAEHLGISISTQAIWNAARQYTEPPHLGNVYLELLFSSLAKQIKAIYPEIAVDYEVNALASYFNLNNKRLCSLGQVIQLVAED